MENLGNSAGKRTYHQVRRAEKADETRRRIIEAARACLTEGPPRSVSLDDIARRAKVARSTVHLVFGSRKDLLQAVADDALERGGRRQLSRAFIHRDALVAFRTSLDAATKMYAAEYAVNRALLSLAATDGDAAEVARRSNANRHEGMETLARRLKRQGYLREDVTERQAADILWVITSFEAYDLLRTGRDLPTGEAVRRLAAMAERSLGLSHGQPDSGSR